MIIPPGFQTQSVVTSLGTIVYYTATPATWLMDSPLPALPTAVGAPTSGQGLDPGANLETAPAQPTLLFLHGFGGGSSAYEWSLVAPAFASEYRVISPDLLGWGRSTHLPRFYEIDDYVVTLREFLAAIGPAPIVAIASSLTAALVMRLASQQPHLFSALILVAPAGLSDFGNDYRRSFIAKLASTPYVGEWVYRLGIATRRGIRGFLSKRQFAQPQRILPEIVEAYLQSAQQPRAELTALSFLRGDLSFDVADYGGQVTTPTAILWGTKAQFTGPEIGQQLQALNPQHIHIYQELPEVGLTPQLEVPALTIGLIRRYLKVLAEKQS